MIYRAKPVSLVFKPRVSVQGSDTQAWYHQGGVYVSVRKSGALPGLRIASQENLPIRTFWLGKGGGFGEDNLLLGSVSCIELRKRSIQAENICLTRL